MIGCEECKYFDNKCNIENGVSCSNTEIVNSIYNKALDDVFKVLLDNTEPTEKYIYSGTIVKVLEQLSKE